MEECQPEKLLIQLFPNQKAFINLVINENKTQADIEDIYNHVESLPYIRSFFDENVSDKTSAFELCKSLKFMYFDKGDVIMSQGEHSDDTLYVIVEGKVSVIVNQGEQNPPADAQYKVNLENMSVDDPYQHSDEISQMLKSGFSRSKQGSVMEQHEREFHYSNFHEEWSSFRPRSQTAQSQVQFANSEVEFDMESPGIFKPPPMLALFNHNQQQNMLRLPGQMLDIPSDSIEKMRVSNDTINLNIPLSIPKFALNLNQNTNSIANTNSNPTTGRSPLRNAIIMEQSMMHKSLSIETNQSRSRSKEDPRDRAYRKQIESFGTKINDITKGGGFGDKALLKENQKFATRNVTIIATTPLLCATLHRQDFLRVVDGFSRSATEKEKCITKEFEFFKHVSSSNMKERYLYYFQTVKLLKNEYVCKQGEVGSGFYILHYGKVTVSKNFVDPMTIYYKRTLPIKISTIETSTFFGAEILFDDSSEFKLTVQVESQKAELFFCPKNLFLSKFPKDAQQELIQHLRLRDSAYAELFSTQCKIFSFAKPEAGAAPSIIKNAHDQNLQNNKELYLQMISNSIEKQTKRVIPKLVNSIETHDQIANQPSITLDGGLNPSVVAFSSQIELTLQQLHHDKDLIKEIFVQKRNRMNKRNQIQNQQKARGQLTGVENAKKASTQGAVQIPPVFNASVIEANSKTSRSVSPFSVQQQPQMKENQESLLREFSRRELLGQPNTEFLDLKLLYNNTEDVYYDKDINFLLYISKPKPNEIFQPQVPHLISDDPATYMDTELPPAGTTYGTSINYEDDEINISEQEEQQQKQQKQVTKEEYEFENLRVPHLHPDEILNTHQDLDIGYIDNFRKEQYFRNIRIGAIKNPNASPPPKFDLKLNIIKRFLKSKNYSQKRFPNLPKSEKNGFKNCEERGQSRDPIQQKIEQLQKRNKRKRSPEEDSGAIKREGNDEKNNAGNNQDILQTTMKSSLPQMPSFSSLKKWSSPKLASMKSLQNIQSNPSDNTTGILSPSNRLQSSDRFGATSRVTVVSHTNQQSFLSNTRLFRSGSPVESETNPDSSRPSTQQAKLQEYYYSAQPIAQEVYQDHPDKSDSIINSNSNIIPSKKQQQQTRSQRILATIHHLPEQNSQKPLLVEQHSQSQQQEQKLNKSQQKQEETEETSPLLKRVSRSPSENSKKFMIKQYPFPFKGKMIFQSKQQTFNFEGQNPSIQINRYRSSPSPPRLFLPHNSEIAAEYLKVAPNSRTKTFNRSQQKYHSPNSKYPLVANQKRKIYVESSLKQKTRANTQHESERLASTNSQSPVRPDSAESFNTSYMNAFKQIYTTNSKQNTSRNLLRESPKDQIQNQLILSGNGQNSIV